MAMGKGKYDDLCTEVREKSGALGAAIIIHGGELGGGFSVQGPMEMQIALPDILEKMAADIRKSFGIPSSVLGQPVSGYIEYEIEDCELSNGKTRLRGASMLEVMEDYLPWPSTDLTFTRKAGGEHYQVVDRQTDFMYFIREVK